MSVHGIPLNSPPKSPTTRRTDVGCAADRKGTTYPLIIIFGDPGDDGEPGRDLCREPEGDPPGGRAAVDAAVQELHQEAAAAPLLAVSRGAVLGDAFVRHDFGLSLSLSLTK